MRQTASTIRCGFGAVLLKPEHTKRNRRQTRRRTHDTARAVIPYGQNGRARRRVSRYSCASCARGRSFGSLFLPPLLILPLPGGGRGGPIPGLMLGGGERLAGMDLGTKPRNRLLHLLPPLPPPPPKSFLHLDGVIEEELDCGPPRQGGHRGRRPSGELFEPPQLCRCPESTRHSQQRLHLVRPLLRLLKLLQLLLPLLLLPLPQSSSSEVPERGVHDFACRAGQQRHGQRQHLGSHVTDRDCPTLRLRLLKDTRPRTSRSGSPLCP